MSSYAVRPTTTSNRAWVTPVSSDWAVARDLRQWLNALRPYPERSPWCSGILL
jgi:hypothetical protein